VVYFMCSLPTCSPHCRSHIFCTIMIRTHLLQWLILCCVSTLITFGLVGFKYTCGMKHPKVINQKNCFWQTQKTAKQVPVTNAHLHESRYIYIHHGSSTSEWDIQLLIAGNYNRFHSLWFRTDFYRSVPSKT